MDHPLEYDIKRKLVLTRLWWDRLWIRENENHPSFKFRINWKRYLTPDEWVYYMNDLLNRRRIARIITAVEEKSEKLNHATFKRN